MKGELVDRARGTALMFRLAREERDSWSNWHRRDLHRLRLAASHGELAAAGEFEWPQERNGRAGCADGHRLPSIHRKTHECGERTKPLELRSGSRLSGKKFSLT